VANSDDEVATSAPQTERAVAPDILGILDQIDAVLEKNSEEFVSGFVQKGGQ
jgi:ubiquitin-like protein Pup